jgi:hypothetical protein
MVNFQEYNTAANKIYHWFSNFSIKIVTIPDFEKTRPGPAN